jgi:hypothetical protein
MTHDPLVLLEDLPVGEGDRTHALARSSTSPGISVDGALIGVVSTDGLIAQVARELAGLSRLLEMQPLFERLRRPSTATPGHLSTE